MLVYTGTLPAAWSRPTRLASLRLQVCVCVCVLQCTKRQASSRLTLVCGSLPGAVSPEAVLKAAQAGA